MTRDTGFTDIPELPFGSWPSPLTAERVVAGANVPGELRVDGDDVWWSESRPAEAGRVQLLRKPPGSGAPTDVLPPGFSARNRVHEYGGGAWAVSGSVLVFSNWADQRLYRLGPEDVVPVALTPEPTVHHGLRYADATIVPPGVWGPRGWVVAVSEDHEPDTLTAYGEAVNQLVVLPLDGDGPVHVLASGWDFVSAPAVAHDGSALAWLRWNHPNMPWDGCELVVAPVAVASDGPQLANEGEVVAGGTQESVLQPEWAADGSLWFLSDRSGWWNLHHRAARTGEVAAVAPVNGEIGGPEWVFGGRWYAFLRGGRIVCSLNRGGITVLAVVDPHRPDVAPQLVDTGLTWVGQVVADPYGAVLVVGGAPDREAVPYSVDPVSGRSVALTPPRDLGVPAEYFSPPEGIAFPSAGGRTAYAVLYRPRNPQALPPEGELPPLLVFSHGGPTAQTRAMLTLGVQYWTSRGFAVVDVNYGGSTGYGRPYRQLLKGQWGIVDVEDCVAAARYLAGQGIVDGNRLAIRGGSAGGFTTLAALTTHDVFAAGASHFGVADLEALARDTHKFESRYLDGLVGPYPQEAALYRERSPIHHTGALSCPLAVFQGLEDEVVPPAQSQMIVDAVKAKGLPYVYVEFEGEQHGFRKAENIIRALESELWFYGKVFDFQPADSVETPPGGGFA